MSQIVSLSEQVLVPLSSMRTWTEAEFPGDRSWDTLNVIFDACLAIFCNGTA